MDFPSAYSRLGRRVGPFASPIEHAAAREFWMNSGLLGAVWLINRVGCETHVESLEAVASMLADMGVIVVRPIMEMLSRRISEDHAEVLMSVLRWVEL